ncbi:hypothetical protein BT67DRAFT_444608 [Trichocladium antarcticum]|uniref:Uncharacterized protein n=1 Tax=Trichocladium antarcticum TaxID=1450529 RepID=A0AAN6ZA70_9PEZI|nr:hypothetical protein BT67DRAFT_444608 [Trichocladium antarcticum]
MCHVPCHPSAEPQAIAKGSRPIRAGIEEQAGNAARFLPAAMSQDSIQELQQFIWAWWQSGLMRKTRNLVPSGASVQIRPTSELSLLLFILSAFSLGTGQPGAANEVVILTCHYTLLIALDRVVTVTSGSKFPFLILSKDSRTTSILNAKQPAA